MSFADVKPEENIFSTSALTSTLHEALVAAFGTGAALDAPIPMVLLKGERTMKVLSIPAGAQKGSGKSNCLGSFGLLLGLIKSHFNGMLWFALRHNPTSSGRGRTNQGK